MTLQELIDELSAATDGASEEPGWRNQHALFPEMTSTRVLYKKRGDNEIEFSQIEVWIEDIDTPQERAYYNKSRIPDPVVEATREVVVPNATPEEIKANIDSIFEGLKFSDVQIQSGAESGVVVATFYETGEAVQKAYRIVKDDKGTFSKFLIKG